ncbi:MAG: carboxypeptidase-like regulatory domain-containing protein, partial [Cyclobacteriaceae bacterium]|nr:carboxypeptidase-like regulatory domain-containing protein [Cyclobacteriaceae bacterium]
MLVASLILVTSCKEKFSEEDALKAQQEVDLAIYVTNQTDPAQPPVAGANVTVTISGKTTSVTTDAAGAALFPKIQVGTYVYKVEAASFITAAGTGSANPSNFRQKQVTQQVNLISLADADLATVKGTITMEKDVTNLTKEGASGVDVYFNVYLNIGQRVFTTKTDANGNYQIKLPTNGVNQQTYVEILYADIEADQVIAVNKFSDEVGSFPQILPRKETLKTVFS